MIPDRSRANLEAGTLAIAFEGSLDALDAAAQRRLFDRGCQARDGSLAKRVARIIAEVRQDGDAALLDLARELDGVSLDGLEVPLADAHAAVAGLDPVVHDALLQARDAIGAVHRAQLPSRTVVEVMRGLRITRRPDPLQRVGVYAPGGRAAYPSSVLMGAVPARVAGVDEVVVCSPPGPDGRPPATVLAACAIAGVDRIFAAGGAGAIAALAYGTQSIPRVDRIVGPGNAYVTEAKRQLTGIVGIDCPAGPSEVLIIADETADPAVVALELLAQAEHDPDAAAVAVSTSAPLLENVRAILRDAVANQPRRPVIEQALAKNGALFLAKDEAQAIRFANLYAPEHLLIVTRTPGAAAAQVRAAGTVFLGASASVAFGDYLTGANHVLPTGGLARSYSGLSTSDFFRWTTIQEVSPEGAAVLASPTAALAEAEGLPGHAAAARARGGRGRSPGYLPLPPAFRHAYANIPTYDPGRRPCAVDLSDNTNLFGVSPSAQAVLARAPSHRITRYPAVYADGLKHALANHLHVEPASITTGCGSDDVIDSALRAFCEPGDTVAYAPPTFGVVQLFARMNAAQPIEVPLGNGFTLDADALLRTRARVIYVCRPNNPTGTLFNREAVEKLLNESGGLVIVDEAYADFAGDDLLDAALASERAVVLRTLSKAYGLAGLRVGFAIGAPALIAEVEKSRGPYKVSAVAEAAAVAAITSDASWVREKIVAVIENRGRLMRALDRLGLEPVPSAANFVLLPVPERLGTATELAQNLRDAGVAVRAFPGLPQVGEAIRITIGPWPMMQAFLEQLELHLSKAPGKEGNA